VSRGDLYIETRKRANGAYVNEEARIVCVSNYVFDTLYVVLIFIDSLTLFT
jgi:hypothetical protein